MSGKIFIKKEFIDAILRSIRLVLDKCIELDALCFDPPATITPLLYCIGYNEYFVRKFWEVFEKLGEFSFTIYKYYGIEFDLVLHHKLGTVMHLRDECIPVEDIVCIKHRLDCVKAPHTHMLYIYIEGRHEGRVFVRTNVLRILRLMNIWRKDSPYKVLELMHKVLYGEEDLSRLIIYLLKIILSNEKILSYILPKIPLSNDELKILSPLIRFLHRG